MEAQRDLQRKAGFNPLSGCLPVFIQIPIFIGLYRCLSVDIELRSAPLVRGWEWCSNLAAPDMFGHWESWMPEFFAGRGSGWLGPYFNVLPVVVVALFLIQQKMFMPPATDEQTRMTQQVMNWMTVVMGVFFFKMPAGLCVYFITSSLWSIAERKLVKKTLPPQNSSNEAANPSAPPVPFWPVEKKLSVSEQIAEKRKRRKKTRPA
jgi:YidC/Oxa1 family membrane protein insertase